MKKEGSMFGQFVREYWFHYHYRYVYRTLVSSGMVFKHLLTNSHFFGDGVQTSSHSEYKLRGREPFQNGFKPKRDDGIFEVRL
ncbi:hypothetical protein Acr_03g0002120 [Actinidia rufa]|uniref:Uncharacterized protein n=1 Tax=Actinidia rufa TaxID=165716 RepID=A0A7J0EAF1_9ERIC|nr:hypothetical protein Acr_03g0002120 [Actinidia rufa]